MDGTTWEEKDKNNKYLHKLNKSTPLKQLNKPGGLFKGTADNYKVSKDQDNIVNDFPYDLTKDGDIIQKEKKRVKVWV